MTASILADDWSCAAAINSVWSASSSAAVHMIVSKRALHAFAMVMVGFHMFFKAFMNVWIPVDDFVSVR